MSPHFVRQLCSGFSCAPVSVEICVTVRSSIFSQWVISLPSNPSCDSVAYCVDTDSDPISDTTSVVLSVPDTALDADSASAYRVANDSLRVLLQHGKRQSVEMDATGSAVACAEAGAPLLSLTNIAGGGMLHRFLSVAVKGGKKTTSQKKCSHAVLRMPQAEPPPN